MFHLNVYGVAVIFAGPESITISDWTAIITVILTAIAVLLGALAVMIAVAAIWGYNTLKDEVVKAATKVAEQKLTEYFANEAEISRLKGMVGVPRPVQPEPGATQTPYTEEEGNGNPSAS